MTSLTVLKYLPMHPFSSPLPTLPPDALPPRAHCSFLITGDKVSNARLASSVVDYTSYSFPSFSSLLPPLPPMSVSTISFALGGLRREVDHSIDACILPTSAMLPAILPTITMLPVNIIILSHYTFIPPCFTISFTLLSLLTITLAVRG